MVDRWELVHFRLSDEQENILRWQVKVTIVIQTASIETATSGLLEITDHSSGAFNKPTISAGNGKTNQSIHLLDDYG